MPTKLWLDVTSSKTNRFHLFSFNLFIILCSKGDLENAVECLELYVKVSEKSGAIESLAKSCRAAGTIFNTLVIMDTACTGTLDIF